MPPYLPESASRARNRERRNGSAHRYERLVGGGVDTFQGKGESDARAKDGRMARGEHGQTSWASFCVMPRLTCVVLSSVGFVLKVTPFSGAWPDWALF